MFKMFSHIILVSTYSENDWFFLSILKLKLSAFIFYVKYQSATPFFQYKTIKKLSRIAVTVKNLKTITKNQ